MLTGFLLRLMGPRTGDVPPSGPGPLISSDYAFILSVQVINDLSVQRQGSDSVKGSPMVMNLVFDIDNELI